MCERGVGDLSLTAMIHFVWLSEQKHRDNDLFPEEYLGNAITKGRLNRSFNSNGSMTVWSSVVNHLRVIHGIQTTCPVFVSLHNVPPSDVCTYLGKAALVCCLLYRALFM